FDSLKFFASLSDVKADQSIVELRHGGTSRRLGSARYTPTEGISGRTASTSVRRPPETSIEAPLVPRIIVLRTTYSIPGLTSICAKYLPKNTQSLRNQSGS